MKKLRWRKLIRMTKIIHLSDHFTYQKLLRFTLPSIIMMIFTSVYSVVDGLFVSNFVGKTAFASVNLIMPVLGILGTVGYMFGAGGSALISKTLGEGNKEKANRLFSLFVYLSIAFGILMMLLGIAFMRPICIALGAEGQLLEDCLTYGRIFILALPAWILLYEFQLFFVVAEKPKLGLISTIMAGVTNIVLDALFIIVFDWGLAGAAIASVVGQLFGGIFPLIYFARKNNSSLKLTKTSFDGRSVLKCCTNGSSEFLSGVSMSLVGIVYNIQLMKYAGENGVAAYGVLMYVSMIFSAAFLGYSSGVAPVIGYHYGAKDYRELRNLLKKSIAIILLFSISMLAVAQILAYPISLIFVGYDAQLMTLTLNAFRIYSFAYLFMGVAILSSAFFTALNNGLISAVVSFMRTFVFELSAVFVLPLILGINGIWSSVLVAEIMAMTLGVVLILCLRKKYHY